MDPDTGTPRPGPPRTGWRRGDRTELPGGVEVAWGLPPLGAGRRRLLGRHRREPSTALVVDVSDGGAGVILGPRSDDVGVGSEVVLGIGEARATVAVVRVDELADGGRRYGVQFLHVSPQFRVALLAGRDRPTAPGRPRPDAWGAPH